MILNITNKDKQTKNNIMKNNVYLKGADGCVSKVEIFELFVFDKDYTYNEVHLVMLILAF